MAIDGPEPAAETPGEADLAGSLHHVLSTLTQIRSGTTSFGLPQLRERLELVSWLVNELGAARELLLAAYRDAGADWPAVAEATGLTESQAQAAYAVRTGHAALPEQQVFIGPPLPPASQPQPARAGRPGPCLL
jgi:hypothetical protein